MKKRARSFIVVFSLILLTFIILEACSTQNAAKPAAFIDPGSDLKKYSLGERELPGLGMVSELKLGKDEISPNAVSGYAANFTNKVENTSSSGYKSLSINLQAYNSAEDTKKDFSRDTLPKEVLEKFHELRINKSIGDESFVYSANVFGQSRTYILYRIENVAVQLNSIGIGTNSTIRYAGIMDQNLKNKH